MHTELVPTGFCLFKLATATKVDTTVKHQMCVMDYKSNLFKNYFSISYASILDQDTLVHTILGLYLRNCGQEHYKPKIMLTITDNDKQIIIALAHFDTLLSEPKMKKKPLLNSTKFFFSKKVNFYMKIVFHLFILF